MARLSYARDAPPTIGPPNRLSPYRPGYLIRTFSVLPLRKYPHRIRPIVSTVSTPTARFERIRPNFKRFWTPTPA